MSKPETKKKLRRFLGMASYYRRFVPHFAEAATPLHSMTGKKSPTKVIWTEESTTAFTRVKEGLVKMTELHAPDYHQPYLLKTDASGVGLGAALEQEKEGTNYPVAFYSRKLTQTEKSYTASELETLAIIDAITHFGVYI